MTDICASCKSTNISKITKLNKDILPKWLEKKNYVDEFIIKKPTKVFKQHNYSMKFKLKIGQKFKQRRILYFAAKPDKNLFTIKDARKAYSDFSNSGVSTINNSGECTIYLNPPQPYKTIKKNETNYKTFYRHMHFVLSNTQNTEWDINTIYTKVLNCSIEFDDLMYNHIDKKQVLLLNTLPCEYYAKSHISKSFNLPTKEIKKMSSTECKQWIKEVLKLNNHPLYKKLSEKKIEFYNLPIVVYCAHKDCDASEKALVELYKKQFVNVVMYEEGMLGYIKQVKNLQS